MFYPVGKAINNENWRVPPALNAKNYDVISANPETVHFRTNLALVNYQNSHFSVQLDRTITLLSPQQISRQLSIELPTSVNQVAYRSHTSLTNLGEDWRPEKGLITLWSMAMLQGTDDSVSMFVIAPEQGPVQSYLYPLYADRLISRNHLVFFKTDGKYRSKIGIPADISGDLILSYSPSLAKLTVLKITIDQDGRYPISLEKLYTKQAKGDVTNAYNHGNMDGSLLAKSAFYELESAAPMLALKTNQSVSHTQQVFHFVGNSKQLDAISQQLVGINVSDTNTLFKSE
ncbi:DUF6786 family protein [Paraglaciecola aquimarina]|uniref:DUF6786 family protein n=1 Tax=Paraglaciecola aquimarina TaxID=1235557 RepID=A0ABU3T0S9_9ALTE|nr:DUF6786 family protein [Paraglaciecola aquimarina]MDU0355869.1 DUF6786 family protein [Paraglaciecola aquimarina]